MNHIHDAVRIEAPVDQVWAFMCDPAHLHDWSPQAEYSDFSGPLDQPGTTLVQHWRIMGFEMKGTMKVLEAEPRRLLHLRNDAGPTDMVFRFEPEGHATLLVLDSDYEMPRHLPAFVQNLMSRSYVERNVRHQLETIKALVEARATVPV
jgi:uncharacterized protein YndB with AHSA1/START domain